MEQKIAMHISRLFRYPVDATAVSPPIVPRALYIVNVIAAQLRLKPPRCGPTPPNPVVISQTRSADCHLSAVR